MAFFDPDFLQFFKDLAPNNNKDWFDVNRSRYETIVREPFKAFVDHLIVEMNKVNPKVKDIENKHCIFRINRDIRFSKDKTPYKMNVSAAILDGGKKNRLGEGVYFEMGPEHVRVYGGLYDLEKESLYQVREGISNNLKEFQKIYSNTSFEGTFGHIRGDQNKIIPKEFREAAEKENLIFNKQLYYFAQFEPEVLLQDNFDQIIMETYNAGRPMEKFFSKLLKR